MTADRAFLEQEYRTPATTEQAYNFGREGGLHGKRRLSRREFLSREETPHPFPSSLWRAYQVGHRDGLELAARLDGATRDGASEESGADLAEIPASAPNEPATEQEES